MRTVLQLLLLFIIAQMLGLVVANAFMHDNGGMFFRDDGYSTWDLLSIVLGFAFAVLFSLALVKINREVLFRLLEFIVITSAVFIVFDGIGWYLGFDWTASLVFAVMLGIAKFFDPRLRNATATLSSTGVAVMFGMFLTFTDAIIFMIVISIYDYVAVFITRHMVTLASEFGKRKMSFSVASEERVVERARVIMPSGKVKEKLEEKTELLELGTGDIAIPLAFNIVVFKTVFPYNPAAAMSGYIVMSTFSLLALALLLVYVKKNRLFLPALPPILLGSVAGYVIAYLSGIIA